MKRQARIWALCALGSLAAHAVLLLLLAATTPGARTPGAGGIEIGLGHAGQSAGLREDRDTLTADSPAAAARQEAVRSAGQSAAPLNPAKPAPLSVPPAIRPAKTAALQKAAPEPCAENCPPAETTTAAVPATANNVPAATSVPAPAERPVADDKTDGEIGDSHQLTNSAVSGGTQTRPGQTAVRGQENTSGSGGRQASGFGDNRGGGSAEPGRLQSYYAELHAWIQRHQTYPDKARRLRQAGVTLVKLGVARDGKLLFARVEKSSGYPLLDQAALDAIKRADPLIAIPASIGKPMLTLIIPMQFILT